MLFCLNCHSDFDCRVYILVYAYTYSDYADAGNAAILHLNVGDKVYLKAHDDYDQTLFGQGDQIYTTFTGELLYADNVGEYHLVSCSSN